MGSIGAGGTALGIGHLKAVLGSNLWRVGRGAGESGAGRREGVSGVCPADAGLIGRGMGEVGVGLSVAAAIGCGVFGACSGFRVE